MSIAALCGALKDWPCPCGHGWRQRALRPGRAQVPGGARMAHWRSAGRPFALPLARTIDRITRKADMSYLFPPAPQVAVPVLGSGARFPVHRIYCVGRNYAEHAQEMGFSGREPPFFFMKPADAVVLADPADASIAWPYPGLTANVHHEIELVVAIGKGGSAIAAADAHQHICGYAVGLDMTRRDLQNEMKKRGRPWCIAKGFDASAPMGPITPAAQAGDLQRAAIWLRVNGAERQRSSIGQMIWSVAETIEQLSAAWALQAGDLIYTGTPAGVGPVQRGDRLEGGIDGLTSLRLHLL